MEINGLHMIIVELSQVSDLLKFWDEEANKAYVQGYS